MFFKGPFRVLVKLAVIGLVVYLAWLAWGELGPQRPEVGPLRSELLERAAPLIADDLRRARADTPTVAMLPLENDPSGLVTNTLRAAIERTGALDLRDRTVAEKARDLLNLRHTGCAAPEAAQRRARELGADAVLYGKVHQFESYPGGATIVVEITLAEANTGRVIFSRTYPETRSATALSVDPTKGPPAGFPWLSRLFLWGIATLLLPVFAIRFIRTMVRKQSNRANAFVLAIFTTADILLLGLLLSPALTVWWTAPIVIAAIVAAFAYNVRIMTLALRLEEP